MTTTESNLKLIGKILASKTKETIEFANDTGLLKALMNNEELVKFCSNCNKWHSCSYPVVELVIEQRLYPASHPIATEKPKMQANKYTDIYERAPKEPEKPKGLTLDDLVTGLRFTTNDNTIRVVLVYNTKCFMFAKFHKTGTFIKIETSPIRILSGYQKIPDHLYEYNVPLQFPIGLPEYAAEYMQLSLANR